MNEAMGHALVQCAAGQRQIGRALRAALTRALRRAAATLARQARMGGFMP